MFARVILHEPWPWCRHERLRYGGVCPSVSSPKFHLLRQPFARLCVFLPFLPQTLLGS